MKKNKVISRNPFEINESVFYEGEYIHEMIERAVNEGEPVESSSGTIYQERKEGVNPAYDIRADKFDRMLDAQIEAGEGIKTSLKKARAAAETARETENKGE